MSSKHKSKSKSKSTTPAFSSNSLFTKTHDTLAPLIPILTSFAHRNHNQHRTSHWWSAFNIFRRSVRNLDAVLIKGKEAAILTHASWMSSHVIPRAYVAFTQLTADNQYASLGLMLIAVLANVASLLSDLAPTETPLDIKGTSAITSTPRQNLSPSLDTSGPDRGVAISREALGLDNHSATTKTPGTKQPKSKLEAPVMNEKPKKRKEKESSGDIKPKKKKKKAGDELSSLFGSLS